MYYLILEICLRFFRIKKNPNEMLEKYFEIMKFIYKLVDKILKTIENTQI